MNRVAAVSPVTASPQRQREKVPSNNDDVIACSNAVVGSAVADRARLEGGECRCTSVTDRGVAAYPADSKSFFSTYFFFPGCLCLCWTVLDWAEMDAE